MSSLVFLTPVGLDAGTWRDIRLPEAPGRTVYRHVYPGHGTRPRPLRFPSLGLLADQLAAWYPGELDLVGVSMGGMVAQHVALRHPERVRSLLLACTNPATDASVMEGRALAAEADGMAAVLDATLSRWFTPEALARRPEHPGVAYARETLLRLDAHTFADAWRAIGGHDVRDALHEIKARTTCVGASVDQASPPARLEEIAQRVPGARLVVVDGPHMLHLEHADVFSQVLDEHLHWVEEG